MSRRWIAVCSVFAVSLSEACVGSTCPSAEHQECIMIAGPPGISCRCVAGDVRQEDVAVDAGTDASDGAP